MFTLLLLLFLVVSEPFMPVRGTRTFDEIDPVKCLQMAKGRFLVYRLRRGMQLQEVTQILGYSSPGCAFTTASGTLTVIYNDAVVVHFVTAKCVSCNGVTGDGVHCSACDFYSLGVRFGKAHE